LPPESQVTVKVPEHCASAGSDKARDARVHAAISQNFRRFAATLQSTTRCRIQILMACPLFGKRPAVISPCQGI
jgi:hypothetical protein